MKLWIELLATQTVADLKLVQGLPEVFISSFMNVIESVKSDEKITR